MTDALGETKGCGKSERRGHGEYDVCGKPFLIGEAPWICPNCQLKLCEQRVRELSERLARVEAEERERCAKAIEAKVAEHAAAFPGEGHELDRLRFNLDGTVFAAAIRAGK